MKHALPRLKNAMTPFPYAVADDAKVAEAQALMDAHAFHHLPVTHAGQVVGMLTAGMLAARARFGALAHAAVAEICSSDIYVVELDEPLATVVKGMAERRVDAAIVLRHGKLVGVFTALDAHRAFAALLESLSATPGDDEAA